MSNKIRRSNKAILLRPISVIIQSVPYPIRLEEPTVVTSGSISGVDLVDVIKPVDITDSYIQFSSSVTTANLNNIVVNLDQPDEAHVLFTPSAQSVDLITVIVEIGAGGTLVDAHVLFTPSAISVDLVTVVIELDQPDDAHVLFTPGAVGVTLV